MRNLSMKSKLGTRLAMENENEETTVEGNPTELAGADTVETAIGEAEDTNTELEENQDQLEQTETTVNAIDKVADALDVAADNGGIDENAAAVVQVAVEALYETIGAKPRFPAMESFGQSSSRVRTNKLAVEALKDDVKDFFKWIMQQIQKAVDWVMGYVNQVIGVGERVQKRAAALKKRAEDPNGAPMGEKTFESESIAKMLGIGGGGKLKVPALSVITAAFQTAKECREKVVTEVVKVVDVLIGTANEIDSKKLVDFPFGSGDSLAHSVGNVVAVVADPEARGYSNPVNANLEFVSSIELPGGKAILGTSLKGEGKGAEFAEAAGKQTIGIKAFSTKSKNEADPKIETLDRSACVALADKCEETGRDLAAWRNKSREITEVGKKLNAAAKTLDSKASKEADGDEMKALRLAGGLLRSSSGLISGIVGGVAGYSYNLAKGSLDYIEKSLGQHKKKA